MITFRSLARSDLRALRLWLNTPHVYEWWGRRGGVGALGGAGEDAATERQVEEKYGSEIDRGGATHRYIIELDGAPVGLIQWYRLGDFPDYARAIGEDPAAGAGIDLFIGAPQALGRGVGSRAIDKFVTTVVFATSGVTRVVAGPAAGNMRSIRAFEKAGFRCARQASVPGEPEPEAVMVRARTRNPDGSAGDANYGAIGRDYSKFRQAEPRIVALINQALGQARTVINVGAGAGSYEPLDREVVAVEPSESMRAQRPSSLPVAIDAVAEKLPFPDAHFDAGMATFTVHQWADLRAGLKELRRVTRGPVLILTCDPGKVQDFWLSAYAPAVLATEARRYPSLESLGSSLGFSIETLRVPIPLNCQDGFNEAYYGRPEMLLNEGARLACSAWSFVDKSIAASYTDHLRREIKDGAWDAKYGSLRTQPEYDGSLRLIVARP